MRTDFPNPVGAAREGRGHLPSLQGLPVPLLRTCQHWGRGPGVTAQASPCEAHTWTRVHCMEDNGADSRRRLGEGPRAPRASCLVVWTPEDLLVGAHFGLRSPSPWSFTAELFLGRVSVSRVTISDASRCQGKKTQGGRAPDGGLERQGGSQLWSPTSRETARPATLQTATGLCHLGFHICKQRGRAGPLTGGWKEPRIQPRHVPVCSEGLSRRRRRRVRKALGSLLC